MPEEIERLRDALYYPYIHIRDERWLKATLLCMPSVKRIVPQEYSPEDEPNIKSYAEIKGPNGALLQSVPSYTPAAIDAQNRLLEKLRQNISQIKALYGSHVAPTIDGYWIHTAKFTDQLKEYLTQHNLAWTSSDPNAVGHRSWFALHPSLGKALMTTLGLAIAREQHYDIVTADGIFHEALLATEEDAIFDTLIGKSENASPHTKSQARNEVGQLVIFLSGVRIDALLPHHIPELQASSNFQKFQASIRRAAATIDLEDDSAEYHRQLKQEAEKIISDWQDARKDVGADLRDLMFDVVGDFGAETIKFFQKGGLEPFELKVAGGLAVWRIATKVPRILDRRDDTRHYLSEVVHAQHPILRLMRPIGI